MVVSYDSADDAAALRLDPDAGGRILLQSTDFFTPIVDDPYQFGQIAAANALSDIYAMGGKPLFALNIVGFPVKELPLDTLVQILTGGQDKAHEAGIHILGGHTIDDKEPKYGMVVTGEVAEDRLIRNNTGHIGDQLVLTKPLGTGIISTAIKAGVAPDEAVAAAIESMTALNRSASLVAQEVGVHALTDVSGFGLLGHLLEMCAASGKDAAGPGLQAAIDLASLPILPGARDLARDGHIPGGTRRNLAYVKKVVSHQGQVSDIDQTLAADAQTSGGLLMAVSPDKVDFLVARLKESQTPAAAVIGSFTGPGQPHITLRTGPASP